MSLLQVKINDSLHMAIKGKAKQYDIPISSLLKIVLANYFLKKEHSDTRDGNVFNADRDNNGKGIPLDDLIDKL